MRNPTNLKSLLDTPPWDWPSDAGKTFLDTLKNPRANQSDRLIAAELAGDFTVIDDELASILLAMVGDPNEPPKLRAQAAVSLGPALQQAYIDEFDDPDSVPITEEMFHQIQATLEKLYQDPGLPKEIRRRILEGAVRAPEPWQEDAIRVAYATGDRDWVLTAVFGMNYLRGFDVQILESLKNPDPEIHCQAVRAAGNWELDAAWPHVVKLIEKGSTPRPLLLAAIAAVGSIRPTEAMDILEELSDSRDEEIAEAAEAAIQMADADPDDDEEDEDEDDEGDEAGQSDWIN